MLSKVKETHIVKKQINLISTLTSHSESTIEELLAREQNPTFYEYFTAVGRKHKLLRMCIMQTIARNYVVDHSEYSNYIREG